MCGKSSATVPKSCIDNLSNFVYTWHQRNDAMLSIRDEEVRTLAQDVMRKTGAPTITAAIKQALANEIARADEKIPLRERVEALRRRVLGDAEIVPDRNTI